MNKNLKKVISAVAALAMSASTFTALAANFSDVPEDASYSQAVQELSALDVISGYDDGTFKPDELVTRAQITKMIVDALNERAMAEASKANSQFVDVNAADNGNGHWARGYINQGVADKFIAGYGDGTFGPDDNVTYVQALKMLVSAIGYETYAQGDGGWPNGYKIWASTTGISDGISGITDDTQLTRAQVAQIVDNAMDAPICIINGYETTILGNTPKLEVKDGKGEDYQTLFTQKHDAYKVYGRVTNTSKMDTGLDPDEVEFRVERADNFDDEYIKSGSVDSSESGTTMYFVDPSTPDLLKTYAQALIQKDDNDEYTIISISAAAANKYVTVAAEDFDENRSTGNNLYFYPAGTTKNSVKYTLASDLTIYLNGVEADDVTDIETLKTYIKDHDTAAITLQKETKSGSTSTESYYNLVTITNYETAVVSEVQDKTDTVNILFDMYSTHIATKLAVERDDETKSYSFMLDGEEIDPLDLEEGDVLSIAYEYGDGKPSSFSDSSFYSVIVSRDTATGRCSSVSSTTPKEYNIDGTKYKLASSGIGEDDIEAGNEYTLYLDHFGRIAKAEEETANKKIGILKNVYKKTGGDWTAQVITKEGIEQEYKVENADKALEYYKLIDKDATAIPQGGFEYDATGADSKTSKYPDQVVEYSVSSSTNKLTIKTGAVQKKTPGTTASDNNAEYKENGTKIGSVKIGDSTVVIDLSEIEDDEVKLLSTDTLVDGNLYEVYGYDRTNSGDRYYRFVLLMSGTSSFNSETQLAVFSGSEIVDVDGDNRTAYNIYVDGEEKQYVLKDDSVAPDIDFAEGDPFLFTVNGANEIAKIEQVFVDNGKLDDSTYETYKDYVLGDISKVMKAKPDSDDSWNDLLMGTSDSMDVVFGIVVNKSGNGITIAGLEDGDIETKIDGDDTTGIWVNYDAQSYDCTGAKTYTYDFSANPNASKVLVDNGIQATTDIRSERKGVKASVNGVDYLNIDAEEVAEDVVFAVARVDDDEVQEIYFIVNEG